MPVQLFAEVRSSVAAPVANVRPPENVVVAAHAGIPLLRVRMNPLVEEASWVSVVGADA